MVDVIHDPGPATGGSAESTVDALVQLSFLTLGELNQVAAGHDLSLTQIRMLGILRDRRPPMLDLGRRLGLTKSSMTGLVSRAEQRGLVRRRPDASDGRGVRVELTPSGDEIAATVAAGVGSRIDAILGPLSAADRQRLTRLASRLVSEGAARGDARDRLDAAT